MSSKREQLKAQRMAEIETTLVRGKGELTLEAIEDMALVTRDWVGQGVTPR